MPASRSPCAGPSAWPSFLPPSLAYLSDPRPHPDPASLPASRRYATGAGWGARQRTLQDDLDELERQEDEHYNHVMDTRQYGYSWLVPLGRQNTHDEDADSAGSTSPHHGIDTTLDLALSPPPFAGGGNATAEQPADEAPVVDLDADIEDADTASGSDEDGGSADESYSPPEEERASPPPRRRRRSVAGEQSMDE